MNSPPNYSARIRRYCTLDQVAARLAECTAVVVQIAPDGPPDQTNTRSATTSAFWRRRCSRDHGCEDLPAAVSVGETAGAHRFHSKGHLRQIQSHRADPRSGSAEERVRLDPGGKRGVNAARHTIAVTSPGSPAVRRCGPSGAGPPTWRCWPNWTAKSRTPSADWLPYYPSARAPH
jgi:hypothetical protein